MPHLALHVPDAEHAAAVAVLCPDAPSGWTRATYADAYDASVAVDAAGGGILALPTSAAGAGIYRAAGRLVVCGHLLNEPEFGAGALLSGLVTTAPHPASASPAPSLTTSHGPGLWVTLDVAPYPNDGQSWSAYAAADYLARAWSELGTADLAHASLVAACRAASSDAPWSEETGYGPLPARTLPAPGALLSTDAETWALFGDPAGGTIVAETRSGRVGQRITAGQGSSRLRARASTGIAYEADRLYRRSVYCENLGSVPIWLVARVSNAAWELLPGESVEASVYEARSERAGFDAQWQLRSGYAADDAGAAEIVAFVADATVETFAGGALTVPDVATPGVVAPFGVTATDASGAVALAWSTLPATTPATVYVDEVAEAGTFTGAATLYLAAGTYALRVEAAGESEAHSEASVTVAVGYVPAAPVPVVTRTGTQLAVTWPAVTGATSYRVRIAPGVGEAATVDAVQAGTSYTATFPGAAVVTVEASNAGGTSAPGTAYAAASGRARVLAGGW